MKDPLVHIGFHKTGTTFLQRKIFHNGSKYFVPLSKDDFRQSTLAKYLYTDRDGHQLAPCEMGASGLSEFDEELNEIKSLRRESLEKKIPVISRERLSGHPSSGGFDAYLIAHRLKNLLPNARILIVIRKQKDSIVSNYIQYLQEGGTHGIKKFLRIRYDGFRPYFSFNYLKYDLLVEEYQKLFGEDRVLVLPYEFFKKSNEDFLDLLSDFLRIRDFSFEPSNEKINVKSNQFLNYQLRFLNPLIISNSYNNYSILYNRFSSKVLRLIIKFLGNFIPESLNKKVLNKIKRAVEEEVGSFYDQSNMRLKELVKFELDKYGY